MVKNREELLQVANSNSAQMKNHLRRAVRSFLDMQHVSPEDLAYVLGITNDEMRQILEGDGNVTVDVLSKLLVATDMAVEIKPVRNTPLGAYGPGMPRSGGRHGFGGMPFGGIPVDKNGCPLPPPPGFMGGPAPRPMRMREERAADLREVPMETNGPARDEHGRFVKKNKTVSTSRTNRQNIGEDNPYAKLPRQELINIIRANIWDGEIDIEQSSQETLAAFVMNKERIMRERASGSQGAEKRTETEAPTANGGNVDEFIEMLHNMADEARNNPALMDAIQHFMPHK
jgi:hypothetical protein